MMKIRRIPAGYVALVAAALLTVIPQSSSLRADDDESGAGIVGAWSGNSVAPGFPPIPVLLRINRDGTFTYQDLSNLGGPPFFMTESAAEGSWVRIGARTVAWKAVFLAKDAGNAYFINLAQGTLETAPGDSNHLTGQGTLMIYPCQGIACPDVLSGSAIPIGSLSFTHSYTRIRP